MGYIYLRKNKFNGKCYVGQTVDIERRNRNWSCLNDRYGGCVINNARKKYGVDGFSFEILKECPNEEMNYWEMYYVKMYNSKKPYGYNSTEGGDSIFEMTDEVRKRISVALRGRKRSAEAVAKTAAAMRGRKLSEEHKAKIGVASRGRKVSEETRKKIADTLRGRKRPDISDALRGKKILEEAKKKMSDALTNHPNMSKAVQALDKATGEVVYEFPSTQEAQRQGFDAGNISKCCRGKLKSHKGYIWRYAEK